MGLQKSVIPNILNFNVNQPVTPWICEINEQTAVAFHDSMMERFEEDPYKPVVLHINSYGGEVDALFSMLDTLDTIRDMAPPEFKIFTVTKGKACSAGAVLLSYGDYRFATPNSRIMIHQVVTGTVDGWKSHPDNEVEFEETARLNTHLLKILKQQCKSKLTMKEFKTLLNKNLYFTPEKAKAFGLIDIIGYPKVIEQKIYEVRVVNGESPGEHNASNRTRNSKASKT